MSFIILVNSHTEAQTHRSFDFSSVLFTFLSNLRDFCALGPKEEKWKRRALDAHTTYPFFIRDASADDVHNLAGNGLSRMNLFHK